MCAALLAAEASRIDVDSSVVGRIWSVESVFDDGRAAIVASPAGKESRFRGGYVVDTSSVTQVFSAEPPVALFNFSWTLDQVVAGPAKTLWGVSDDEKGGNVKVRTLHYYAGTDGPSTSLGSRFDYERLLVSSDGSRAFAYNSPSDGTSALGTLEGDRFSATDAVELTGSAGLRPVSSASLDTIFFLSQAANQTLDLNCLDLGTGVVTRIDNLGNREQLGLYNGHYLKEVNAIAASSDGRSVIYPYVAGSEGVTMRRTFLDRFGRWSSENLPLAGAREPALSSDGRYVAYRRDSEIMRYDRVSGIIARLSPEGVDCASSQPVISPNGRHVAFLDAEGNLWKADSGPSINFQTEAIRVPKKTEEGMGRVIGMTVDGASESTTITWSPVPADTQFPGVLEIADVEEGENPGILPGVEYPVSTLPWVIRTDGTAAGRFLLRFTLSTGDQNLLEVVVSDFDSLTGFLPPSNNVYAYPEVRFVSDDTLEMMTTAPLDSSDSALSRDYYRTTLPSGEFTRLEAATDDVAHIHGTRNARFWIRQGDSCLYRENTRILGTAVSTATVSEDGPIAALSPTGELLFYPREDSQPQTIAQGATTPRLSRDGRTLLWVEEGKLKTMRIGIDETPLVLAQGAGIAEVCGISQDAMKIVAKRTDGRFILVNRALGDSAEELPVPAGATSVAISDNGRRIVYLATNGADSLARVYALDTKQGGLPVCLTPEIVQPCRYPAISPSGRRIAFSTVADMQDEGRSIAQNKHVNLYVWEDTSWRNYWPNVLNTTAATMLEDSPETDLRISFSDSDNDALVVRVVNPPLHGACRVVPPDASVAKYKILYTPDPDFCGEDSMVISVSDAVVYPTYNIRIPVTPVNDPPVWTEEPPRAIEAPAVAVTAYPLAAHDPDTGNQVSPDRLVYSISSAPAWMGVSDNGLTGLLTVNPPISAAGHSFPVTLNVSDGTVDVPLEIQVTVKDSGIPLEISSALLFGDHQAPGASPTVAERYQAALAGCWKNLRKGEWTPLSLPGDASVTQLEALLQSELYVHEPKSNSFIPATAGILPAGTGFWAAPSPDPAAQPTLTLIPRAPSNPRPRFLGPLWDDAAPSSQFYRPVDGTWSLVNAWSIGMGVFSTENGE